MQGTRPRQTALKKSPNGLPTLGYKGGQIPTVDLRLFDLSKAADSQDYCDEVNGICAQAGVEITELSTHLQGQLAAANPADNAAFDTFALAKVHGTPQALQKWAVDQVKRAARASRRLGLDHSVSCSGSLAFPYLYPWPQRQTDWSKKTSQNSPALAANF